MGRLGGEDKKGFALQIRVGGRGRVEASYVARNTVEVRQLEVKWR